MSRPARALCVAGALGVVVSCSGSDGFDPRSQSADQPTDDSSSVDDAAADRCPPSEGADTVTREFPAPPPFCLDPSASYSATISTSTGDLTIDLDQDAAPQTVNNFVFLARNNYFDDTVCHRVVRDFVVQCGDPTATGTGGPGYLVIDELPAPGAYEIGSLAMANSAQPDTNGSQFFIVSGENGVALPPQYSLFGQVADEGLGVVASMNALAPTDGSEAPTEEIRILDVEIVES